MKILSKHFRENSFSSPRGSEVTSYQNEDQKLHYHNIIMPPGRRKGKKRKSSFGISDAKRKQIIR